MAHRILRALALLFSGALLAGALFASPAAAEPPYPCSDPRYDVSPNGDGSYHYDVATPGVEVSYGSCYAVGYEGNTPTPPPPPTPPTVGVCEGPFFDVYQDWWDGSYHYRVGGKVQVGSSCVGAVQQGETPPVCDPDPRPVFGYTPNADGSQTVTAGVTYETLSGGRCRTNTQARSVTIPAPPSPTVDVCASAYDVEPDGYGGYRVHVAYKVSVNGGSCTGVDYGYTIP